MRRAWGAHRRQLCNQRPVLLAGLGVAVPRAQAPEAGGNGVAARSADLRPNVQQRERLQVDALRLPGVTVVVCEHAAKGHAERRVAALTRDFRLADLAHLLLWTHLRPNPTQRRHPHRVAQQLRRARGCHTWASTCSCNRLPTTDQTQRYACVGNQQHGHAQRVAGCMPRTPCSHSRAVVRRIPGSTRRRPPPVPAGPAPGNRGASMWRQARRGSRPQRASTAALRPAAAAAWRR